MQRGFRLSFFAPIIVLAVLAFGGGGIVSYATKHEVAATVTRSERVCSGGEQVSCRYLVYTDVGTFENTDTMWFLKFNSSDLYGQIRDGEAYRFQVTGFRVPFMSWYQNIVSAEPASGAS